MKKHLRPATAVVQIPAPPDARVVKWQTRTFEGRMPQGVGVQVPPRAEPIFSEPLRWRCSAVESNRNLVSPPGKVTHHFRSPRGFARMRAISALACRGGSLARCGRAVRDGIKPGRLRREQMAKLSLE